MKCRAIPYEGNEPYIFLSYCHKDADRVYPLLEQLVSQGYRVWYDDGNHPGDDWLENIARHLNDCRVCLAMVSENSGASHNCRNEINLAIECGKKLMAVLIEDFVMPLGMRLQLGTVHYLKKQDYPSDRMLLRKLCETEDMQACLGAPGKLSDVLPETPKTPENSPKKEVFRMNVVPLDEKTPESWQVSEEDAEKTVIAQKETEEEEKTRRAEALQRIVLLRMSKAQGYILDSALIQLGRSKKCDVVLGDNPYIGNHHAELIQYKGHCYLRDRGSVNGTFVGEEQLPAEGRIRLENRASFRLYNEPFLLFYGAEAQQLADQGQVFFIRNPKTPGIKFLQDETLPLDRSHKWEDGTMGDVEISRSPHAAVSHREEGLYLEDKGHRNGVWLNDSKLPANGACRLKSGDKIRLGQTTLEIGIVTLKGEN